MRFAMTETHRGCPSKRVFFSNSLVEGLALGLSLIGRRVQAHPRSTYVFAWSAEGAFLFEPSCERLTFHILHGKIVLCILKFIPGNLRLRRPLRYCPCSFSSFLLIDARIRAHSSLSGNLFSGKEYLSILPCRAPMRSVHNINAYHTV